MHPIISGMGITSVIETTNFIKCGTCINAFFTTCMCAHIEKPKDKLLTDQKSSE